MRWSGRAPRGSVASREGGVDRNPPQPRGRVHRRRLPRGGRGSQPHSVFPPVRCDCRLPRGGRGSQHPANRTYHLDAESPPARGAWIATFCGRTPANAPKSPPARGAWIATCLTGTLTRSVASPPARGAWIATVISVGTVCAWSRLPRGGRGSQPRTSGPLHPRLGVASREGGVDRNPALPGHFIRGSVSPPARGAWIATLREDHPG